MAPQTPSLPCGPSNPTTGGLRSKIAPGTRASAATQPGLDTRCVRKCPGFRVNDGSGLKFVCFPRVFSILAEQWRCRHALPS
jgi:hypothetical protein